ncbi:MAG: hypothetical protein WDZ59_15720 [Pirellulales bacterium]
MRTVLPIFLLLLAFAVAACRMEVRTPPGYDGRPARWVRTAQGWEDANRWQRVLYRHRPALHPAVVAGVQLFASLMALLAFPAPAATGAAVPLRRDNLRPHVHPQATPQAR